MVELMFALMIFTVVLLGLVSVLGFVLRDQFEGRTYEKVAIAADTVFGQAGHALAENFDRDLVPNIFPAGSQKMANLEGISYAVSETKERDNLVRVDVSIYWNDKDNVAHQKDMSTKFLRSL